MSNAERSISDLEAANAVTQMQYLTFLLQKERFAIAISHIKEIIQHCHLTIVPKMPDFISGVINLRGSVVPVVDLSSRFMGNKSKVAKRTCIVITEMAISDEEIQVVGVVVDAVDEVIDIPITEIEPSPTFGAKIRADFIEGMAKLEDEFVIILDISKVLTAEDLNMLGATEKLVENIADDSRIVE